jgi:biotin carboxylase
MNYTNLINQDKDIIKYASFIQKCVDKKFEIRAFFLNGDLYSMAIFSQNNSQTNIDFRHYDYDLPNRNIPFKFPQKISNQISTFMKAINLNCGSLDFIYSKNKEFIFLEVNPVGQFGMTSQPCNYNLEKIIATTLLKDEK